MIILEKNNRELPSDFIKQLLALDNGRYLINIRCLDLKSIRDYNKEYFACIDEVVAYTGEKRYEVHERFKADQGILSTKDFTEEDWVKFIADLRWWAYNKLDMVL